MAVAGESPLVSPTHPLRNLARPPKTDGGSPESGRGDGPDPQLLIDALDLAASGWRQALGEAMRRAAEPGTDEKPQAARKRETEKARTAWEAAEREAAKAAPAGDAEAGAQPHAAPPAEGAGGAAISPSCWWLAFAFAAAVLLTWLRRKGRP